MTREELHHLATVKLMQSEEEARRQRVHDVLAGHEMPYQALVQEITDAIECLATLRGRLDNYHARMTAALAQEID